uniref:hypothetical protein n=1 Tax=Gemmata palustris TaxID=2822762 RepID=UPI001FE3DB12|nr:hypothetical protein [Gemmata palustris]
MDEPKGWVAFFCTDPTASVADILGLIADRFSLETCFRDLKQVAGAGHQQVRGVASNVGCFHLCAWSLTLTEVWAWNQKADELVAHRAASPWDDPNRPEPRGQAPGLATGAAGRGNSGRCGRAPRPRENPRPSRRCLDLAA